MNPIAEIRKRLEGHPKIKLTEEEYFICATPNEGRGFSVSLMDESFHYTVTFGEGWHDHIASAQEALDCFGFGLSESCRLRVCSAGSFAYKWTVEYFGANEWSEESTTSLIFFPFWRSRHITYHQNRITTRNPDGEWHVRSDF